MHQKPVKNLQKHDDEYRLWHVLKTMKRLSNNTSSEGFVQSRETIWTFMSYYTKT